MTPPSPSVAVAMATYQGEAFVGGQLRTILDQSRPPDVVCIRDDGSTDGTLRVVQRTLEASAVPSVVRVNPERLGARKNFAVLLAEQDADLVFLADQDDLWRPNKVRRLVDALEAVPAAGAAFSNGGLVDAHGAPIAGDLLSRTGFGGSVRAEWTRGAAFRVLLRRTVAPGATVAVRGDLLRAALPMSPHGWHDHWLMLIAAALGPVVVVDEQLVDYRLHETNAVGLVPSGRLARLRGRLTVPEGDAQAGRAHEAAFFSDLAERLADLGAHDAAAEASAASEHARRRLALPQPLHSRVPAVGRRLLTGDYGRYSNGWQSAVGDLLGR